MDIELAFARGLRLLGQRTDQRGAPGGGAARIAAQSDPAADLSISRAAWNASELSEFTGNEIGA
jgi:hypothetical protein